MLGMVVVGRGVLDAPHVELSEYGIIVKKHISQLNAHYSDVAIEKYVIMPNHIHAIIVVENDDAVRVSLCSGASGTPRPTNATIPAFISTLKRFINKEIGFNIWQPSFHDRIIRNEDEYQKIWQYIDQNPVRWQDDYYYTK